MRPVIARRLATACILPAAALAALAGPSAASASPFLPASIGACQGQDITGQGATVEEFSQVDVWTSDFNTYACPLSPPTVTEPVVTYKPTSSGPALESWGVEGGHTHGNFAPTNAFLGTDNGPDATQREEIEEEATGGVGAGPVETVPVEQVAIAVIVNLPEGCSVKGKLGKTKLARYYFSNAQLQAIFEGKETWDDLTGVAGEKLKCKGKADKGNGANLIKRVVRLEGAGTVTIMMKYLYLINNSATVDNGKSWDEEAQLAGNTTWPNEATNPVIRGKGNSGVVKETAANPGSVGIVSLPNARVEFGEHASATKFWAELENGSGTFADPSTDGDTAAKALSNCNETNYTNGTKHFPPTSVYKAWNEVTTATTEPNYTLCGLAYVLAPQVFQPYAAKGATAGAARTVRDYVNYVLDESATGGQTKVNENHDYLALPSVIDGIAKEGAEEITYEP
jgi:ABC-type phosphate transport system substrate-binding protein